MSPVNKPSKSPSFVLVLLFVFSPVLVLFSCLVIDYGMDKNALPTTSSPTTFSRRAADPPPSFSYCVEVCNSGRVVRRIVNDQPRGAYCWVDSERARDPLPMCSGWERFTGGATERN